MRIAIAETPGALPSITLLATIPVSTQDEGRRIVGLLIDLLCADGDVLSREGRGCVITWEVVPIDLECARAKAKVEAG